MNLEQREKMMAHVQKLEPPSPRLWRSGGLLSHSVAHGDEAEAARLRAELTRLVEGL